MALKSNRPAFGVAFETSLLEDVALEPNTPRDGVLDVSLLGDTPLEPEKTATVDENLVVPNKLLLEGGWVDALLPEGAEFEPNRLPPGDSVFFCDSSIDDPNVQLLLPGTLLVAEEPKLANLGTTDSFLASLVPVSPLVPAVVATIPVVRAVYALAMPFPTSILGCVKGFTAQVCVLNSSFRFLLFVSGSR